LFALQNELDFFFRGIRHFFSKAFSHAKTKFENFFEDDFSPFIRVSCLDTLCVIAKKRSILSAASNKEECNFFPHSEKEEKEGFEIDY